MATTTSTAAVAGESTGGPHRRRPRRPPARGVRARSASAPTVLLVHGYPDDQPCGTWWPSASPPTTTSWPTTCAGPGPRESPPAGTGTGSSALVADAVAVADALLTRPAGAPRRSRLGLDPGLGRGDRPGRRPTGSPASRRSRGRPSTTPAPGSVGACGPEPGRWRQLRRQGVRVLVHRRLPPSRWPRSPGDAAWPAPGPASWAGARARWSTTGGRAPAWPPTAARGVALYRRQHRGPDGGRPRPGRTDIPVQVVVPTGDPFVTPARCSTASGARPPPDPARRRGPALAAPVGARGGGPVDRRPRGGSRRGRTMTAPASPSVPAGPVSTGARRSTGSRATRRPRTPSTCCTCCCRPGSGGSCTSTGRSCRRHRRAAARGRQGFMGQEADARAGARRRARPPRGAGARHRAVHRRRSTGSSTKLLGRRPVRPAPPPRREGVAAAAARDHRRHRALHRRAGRLGPRRRGARRGRRRPGHAGPAALARRRGGRAPLVAFDTVPAPGRRARPPVPGDVGGLAR